MTTLNHETETFPHNYDWVFPTKDDKTSFPPFQKWKNPQPQDCIKRIYLVITKRGKVIVGYPCISAVSTMKWISINNWRDWVNHEQVFAYKEIDLTHEKIQDFIQNSKFSVTCKFAQFYQNKTK